MKKANKKNKIYFKPVHKFCGLDYLTLTNCPVYKDKNYGEVIDLTAKEMEILAAEQIVKNMVPFRGIEISILRNALGLSYESFARVFKLSAATVFKWEKARYEYVSLPNDLMLRLFASEELGCDIEKDFSKLSKIETPSQPITFEIAA